MWRCASDEFGRPSSQLPQEYDELWISNGEFNCTVQDDYFSTDIVSSPKSSVVRLLTAPVTIAEEFFGMHRLEIGQQYGELCGTVRSHDSRFSGQSLRWNSIETSAGVYDWSSMDEWVFNNAGKNLIYVLGFPPEFRVVSPVEGPYGRGSAQMPDIAAWGSFCAAVSSRYSGVISTYEIFNEVNVQDFWLGTFNDLAVLTRIARAEILANDLSAKIASPSVVGLEDPQTISFLSSLLSASDSAGGVTSDHVDMASVHLYANANISSAVYRSILSVRSVLSQNGLSIPIINTETSLHSPKWSAVPASRRRILMKRMVSIAAAMGVQSFCWYGCGYTNGYALDEDDIEDWNQFFVYMTSGEIQSATLLFDGRVCVDVAGDRRVF